MAQPLIIIPKELETEAELSHEYVKKQKFVKIIPRVVRAQKQPGDGQVFCGICHDIYNKSEGCVKCTPCTDFEQCGRAQYHADVMAEIDQKNTDLAKVYIYYIFLS